MEWPTIFTAFTATSGDCFAANSGRAQVNFRREKGLYFPVWISEETTNSGLSLSNGHLCWHIVCFESAMSYDLSLGTYPDQDFSLRDLDVLKQDLEKNSALPRLCEITPGRLTPSPIDILTLGEGLDFGDFSERDFTDFCSQRGLPADREHQVAAAAFLRSRWGFTVFTFKLPRTDQDARAAYSEIVALASRYKLRLGDPQEGEDVDLLKPGSLPPGWNA